MVSQEIVEACGVLSTEHWAVLISDRCVWTSGGESDGYGGYSPVHTESVKYMKYHQFATREAAADFVKQEFERGTRLSSMKMLFVSPAVLEAKISVEFKAP